MRRLYQPVFAEALVSSSDLDEQIADLVAILVIEGYLRSVDHERPREALALMFQVFRDGVPQQLTG